jgi:hypothetical protein
MVKDRRDIMGSLLPDPHATPAQREMARPVINPSAGIR